MLTRDQILAAQDVQTSEVEVPGWGGICLLQEIPISEQGLHHGYAQNLIKQMHVDLIVRAMVDKSGKKIFVPADAATLVKKSAEVLRELYEQCLRVNGMSPEAIDESAENLDKTQTESSDTL